MTDDTLASWRDGPAKRAIVDFVRSASEEGSGFVPVADRIATFDNDGTLWVEQPMPPQFDFVFRKWAQEVQANPSLAREQPYQAIIEKDEAFFEGIATQDPKVVATLLAAFVRSWAGTTPEQFDEQVRVWLTTVNQPKFGVPYVKLVYQPMLELLDLLKANDWRVFVCSGGGRDFMRVFAEETWGIYKERVIGSAAAYTYADGKIVRSEEVLGAWTWARASPSTSSLRPGGCRRSPVGTPMWTSRCSKRRSSQCSSTTTTRTASSPTPRPQSSRWPRPGSWAGRW